MGDDVRGKKMKTDIRPLTLADYDAACALWKETDGMSVADDDTRAA